MGGNSSVDSVQVPYQVKTILLQLIGGKSFNFACLMRKLGFYFLFVVWFFVLIIFLATLNHNNLILRHSFVKCLCSDLHFHLCIYIFGLELRNVTINLFLTLQYNLE